MLSEAQTYEASECTVCDAEAHLARDAAVQDDVKRLRYVLHVQVAPRCIPCSTSLPADSRKHIHLKCAVHVLPFRQLSLCRNKVLNSDNTWKSMACTGTACARHGLCWQCVRCTCSVLALRTLLQEGWPGRLPLPEECSAASFSKYNAPSSWMDRSGTWGSSSFLMAEEVADHGNGNLRYSEVMLAHRLRTIGVNGQALAAGASSMNLGSISSSLKRLTKGQTFAMALSPYSVAMLAQRHRTMAVHWRVLTRGPAAQHLRLTSPLAEEGADHGVGNVE